jgi:hypothetical protein
VPQTLVLGSGHSACLREKTGEQKRVVIIDLADANEVLPRPMTADNAIVNPRSKFLHSKVCSSCPDKISAWPTEHSKYSIVIPSRKSSCIRTTTVESRIRLSSGDCRMPLDHSRCHLSTTKMFDRYLTLAGAQSIIIAQLQMTSGLFSSAYGKNDKSFCVQSQRRYATVQQGSGR